MGLWSWMTNQIPTRKFWNLVKKDGLLQTYLRGHKAVMHSHSVGGYKDNAKFVGRDEFGNRYYEDFDCFHPNQRRWVEYADYLLLIGNNGDRIPPKWHGWLSYTYDDVPTYGANEFVQPFYQKPHTWMFNPKDVFLPKFSVMHTENVKFLASRRDRYAQEWDGSSTLKIGRRSESADI